MAQGKKGEIDQDYRLNIRIDSTTYKAARVIADQQGITFSQLVRNLLTAEIVKSQKSKQHTSDK